MTHCSLIYDETSHSPAPATARYGLCLVLAGLLPLASALSVAEVKQFPLLMPHARPARPETYLCTTVTV